MFKKDVNKNKIRDNLAKSLANLGYENHYFSVSMGSMVLII